MPDLIHPNGAGAEAAAAALEPLLTRLLGERPAAAVHTMAELREIVADGLKAGQHRIVIPPGIYRGAPEKGKKVHLTLSGISDTEILADEVTMVCTDPASRAITFSKCAKVTLQGLTVDYDPLPFTQGDVVSVNADDGWMDVKIHAGYPVVPAVRVDIVDHATRYRKRDKPFMWDSKAEVRAGGVVRVLNKAAAKFARAGDLASLGGVDPAAGQVVAHTLALENCAAMVLSKVTVYSSNCMGIVAGGGEGGHRFTGCRVVPGPPPPGATEPRILSVDADAILTSSLRKGVLTEGCEIRDAGDDSWSVQSSDFVIVKQEGRTLWLGWRETPSVKAGDGLQASLAGPAVKVASCEVVPAREVPLAPSIQREIESAGRWGFWHLSCAGEHGRLIKALLESDSPWKEGESVYNRDAQGNGFVFRNNRVRSSGRILIKASGVVEGNYLEGPAAIAASPEVPYPGAAGIESLVIRKNTIVDAHMFNAFYDSSQAGAISVTDNDRRPNLRAAGSYGKVTIEGNVVRGGNGAGIVVSSARKVVIKDNRLENLLHVPPNNTGGAWNIDNHAAVWLANCDKVELAGNQLLNPGPQLSQPIGFGPGVKDIEGCLAVTTGSSTGAAGSQTVPVSSLGIKLARQYGFWAVVPGKTPDFPSRNVPSLNGLCDPQGISARGESVIAFDLHGTAERLTALTGIDDGVKTGSQGPAECVVYGDGKPLWRSGQLKAGQPRKVDVDLRGVKILELAGEASGDNVTDAHLDWLTATLRFHGEKPVNIEPPVLAAPPAVLAPTPSSKPRINGARVFGVRPGAPFLFTVAASGQRPMTFSAAGLPSGLAMDPANGRIEGTLNTPGEYTVALRAVNALGAAERKLRIVVGETISLAPAMGWSSWNCWARDVDQDKVLRAARALASSGLIDHGFTYVNIDDAWQGKRGGAFNGLQGNEKFPDIKGMCDEIHRLGLKAGIYSTPWIQSYAGYPGGSSESPDGSWAKTKGKSRIGPYWLMDNDARQWAAWGIDYLKCDWHPPRPEEASRVAASLRKCGRDIVISLSCDAPFEFAPSYSGIVNSWRTTTDIVDTWQLLSGIAFSQDRCAAFGRPGCWIDPDMMELGAVSNGKEMHPTRLTPDEQYLHVSMWCLLSAPLILGCDLEKIDAFTLGLITNDEVLDLDQDALGKPARRKVLAGYLEVWVKDLENGSKAIGLFNRGRKELQATVDLAQLGLHGEQSIRDLWRCTDLGRFNKTFETKVRPHGVVLVRTARP